jgi:hypothetical protein
VARRKCRDCDGTGDVISTYPVGPKRRPVGYVEQYALCLTCGGTGRR